MGVFNLLCYILLHHMTKTVQRPSVGIENGYSFRLNGPMGQGYPFTVYSIQGQLGDKNGIGTDRLAVFRPTIVCPTERKSVVVENTVRYSVRLCSRAAFNE